MNGNELTKWQDEITSIEKLLRESEAKLQDLGEPLSTWEKAWSSLLKYGVSYGLCQDILTAFAPQVQVEKLPLQVPSPATRRVEDITKAKAEYDIQLSDYTRNVWFGYLYSASPMDLKAANINSYEDYIRQHPPEPNSSPEDLAKARNYVNTILGVGEVAPTDEAYAAELAKWFVTTPAPTKPTFKGVHLTTVDEMSKWLRQIMPPPELPPGLGGPELLNYLKDEGYTDEELAAAAEAANSKFGTLIEEFELGRQQIAEYKAGGEVELPERTFWGKLKFVASQPALAAMDVLQLYQTYWDQPRAGWIAQFTADHMYGFPFYFQHSMFAQFYPDNEIELLREAVDMTGDLLRNDYNKNREAGMNHWTAMGKAWEDLESNEWAKMGLEIFTDPVNVLGFGWLMQGAKATRGIPVLGRIFGASGAFERGFIRFCEAPFGFVKTKLLMRIPKTTGQKADYFGRQITDMVKMPQERIAGKALENIPADDFVEANLKAIRYAVDNPAAVDETAMLGRAYIARKQLTHTEFIEWGRAFGKTFDPSDITPGMIQDLESIVASTITPGSMSPAPGRISRNLDAAAQDLCRNVFNIADDETNMKIAKGLITSTYDRTVAEGIKMAKLAPLESLQTLKAHGREIILSEGYEKWWLWQQRHGFMAGMVNTIEPIYRRIWQEGIEKHLVMPFARAFLLTGNYFPYNYVEEVLRTYCGRGGGVYGRVTPARANVMFIGLSGVDPELARSLNITRYGYRDIGKALVGGTLQPVGIGEMTHAVALTTTEREFGVEMVEKALTGGWIPKIGNKVHNAALFPINASQLSGGIQRNGYCITVWQDNLTDLAPKTMVGIEKSIPKFTPTIGIGDDIGKGIHQMVHDASLVGPSAVQSVPSAFTARNIKMGQVNKAVMKYGELTEVWDVFLKGAYTGELWDDLPAFMVKSQDILADRLINAPRIKADRLQHLVDDLLASTNKIETKEQIMGYAHALQDISMESPETISSLFTGAQHRISTLPTAAARETAWAEAYSNIMPFLNQCEKQSKRLSDHIKANLGDLLTKTEVEQLDNCMDVAVARVLKIQDTRKVAMKKSEELIARKVRPNSPEWIKELTEIWEKHFTIDAELLADQISAARGLGRVMGVSVRTAKIDATGRALTPADIAKLFHSTGDQISYAMMNSASLMRKEYFVALVRRQSIEMASAAGTTRQALGFTDDAIGEVYDKLIYGVRSDPAVHDILTRKYAEMDNLSRDLESIRINHSVNKEAAMHIQGYCDEVADNLRKLDIYQPVKGQLAREGTDEWWRIKQEAMDKTMLSYHQEFTDYTNLNILDKFMTHIFPYWTYESQRWFWLPRNFATHPLIMNTWGKFMDNSDFGYVHIPGTSLDVNFTRGTVYKGGMSSLVRRDYPEYYDQMFPEFVETMDYVKRWGFFPNVFWELLLTSYGGRKPQTGQILPTIVKTPLDLFIAAHPESDVAKKLYGVLFPDYFQDYMRMTEVSDKATTDQIQRGITGVSIWEKMERNETLTAEEQGLWDNAVGRVSLMSPWMSHAGVFRMRHEDRIRAYEWWGEYIEEITGVNVKTQKWLRMHGYTVGDVCPGLSQLDIMQIQEAEEYMRWIKPRVTASLRPSSEIEDNLIQSEFWGMVRRHREANNIEMLRIEGQAFRGEGGWISKAEYVDKMRGISKDNADYIHEEHGDTFNHTTGEWEANPVTKNKFSWIPLTAEERALYYAEKGINLNMGAFDEMLNEWFQLTVKEKIDPVTNTPYLDWGTFFATQDAIEKMLPPELKSDWHTYLRHNETPGRTLYREAVENYLVPYWNVSDVIKKEMFTPEEQDLIDEYYAIQDIDPTRAAEIQEITRPNGLKLISQYRTMTTNARKKLRMTLPTLDAQLLYWNVTSTLLTPEAQLIYDNLTSAGRAT